MVTQFAFTPTYTTLEYRELPFMVEKVARINKIRTKKSAELVAAGNTALDPYTFDYLLLCNKICGASHYNMQMKIVVDTPEDYKKWFKEQVSLVQKVKESNEPAPAAEGTVIDSTAVSLDTVSKVVMK